MLPKQAAVTGTASGARDYGRVKTMTEFKVQILGRFCFLVPNRFCHNVIFMRVPLKTRSEPGSVQLHL